tara:strand:- start:3710 stop:5179 length:1470 start_codon:yes stop_codon:yes gene_type:complete
MDSMSVGEDIEGVGVISESGRFVVLGAGPAGLAAAYRLARAGLSPLLLERAPRAGGLMQGIKNGEYSVDLGRKEIYERNPEVTELLDELLGDDFEGYPHRVGLLYQNHIIEYSMQFLGALRGVPLGLLAGMLSGLVWARLKSIGSTPRNYEERWHQAWGPLMSRALSQGYSEKFYGVKWIDRPVDSGFRRIDDKESKANGQPRRSLTNLLKHFRHDPDAERLWRHPKGGTQALVDSLVAGIEEYGGEIRFGTEVKQVNSSESGVQSVEFKSAEGVCETVNTKELVSAVPMMVLANILGLDSDLLKKDDRNKNRMTILLYLFLDAPSEFEHAWLNVTSPDLLIGRVTNYGSFASGMIPEGKGCLCLEVFTTPEDPFARRGDEEVISHMIQELVSAELLNEASIVDRRLIRLPGGEASNESPTWTSHSVTAFQAQIRQIENLYDVNRAGVDVALYAGLIAANAIETGSRTEFDELANPSKAPTYSQDKGAL